MNDLSRFNPDLVIPYWDLSCPDWEKRLLRGESLMPDLPLFEEESSRALLAFNKMRIPDALGQPLFSSAVDPWFKEIVEALFGSFNRALNMRMINEAFILVPKKSGKTTLSAALMLVALILNRRRNVEFLLVGPTHAIAELSYRQAREMIRADAVLSGWFHCRDHLKEIEFLRTGARLKIKSFDAGILTGVILAGILLDELWQIALDPAAESVMRQIRGGLLANPEAFLVTISTQSDFEPRGVFRDDLIAAREIRDGKLKNARTLPIIYEFPQRMQESGEWKDPRTWHFVNPSLGRAVTIQGLIESFEKEARKSEAQMQGWASQHLNIEVGLGLASNESWPGIKHWKKNAAPFLTLDTILEWSDVVVSGVDGGSLDDLTGLGVLGRHKITRQWMLWCKAWVRRSVLDLRKEMATKLLDLERAGDLSIIDDESDQDVREMAGIFAKIEDTGLFPDVDAIGLDQWKGLGPFVEAVKEICGFSEEKFVKVPQGGRLMGYIQTAEIKLARGELIHADQSLMDWCVTNAKREFTKNTVVITKTKSASAKIDPLMATFMAIAIMSQDPEAAGAYGNPTIMVH